MSGPLRISGSSMLAAVEVEVWTSAGATIGVVTKLMHMEAVEAVSQSSQLPSHLHRPTEKILCTGFTLDDSLPN